MPVTRRDRQLLFALAGIALALASLTLLGVHSDVLLSLPVLVLALPLLSGRYVGEEQILRLAAAFVTARRRPVPVLAPDRSDRTRRSLPRGGTLLACSLAVRPPPAHARMTA